MYFVLVQSRLSFQVLPTSPTENSSDANTEPVDEFVVEFGCLAEADIEVDGVASWEVLSSVMGESLYSLELLL